MQPPRIDRCRLLELGCASGANLMPIADAYPNSEFVGIDSSRVQIEAGRQVVAALGLKNLRLEQLDIAEVDERLGQFDYILCHGVFSWVVRPLQETILGVCRARSAPRGIAYISYNAYPGWHLRTIIRQAMLQSAGQGSVDQRMRRSRQVLDFLAAALAGDARPYARLLKGDIETLLKTPDAYLFHEFLEDVNEPLYFHQFAARLPAHGLQYLGDPMPANMFAVRFGSEFAERVLALGDDLVSVEQHLDLCGPRRSGSRSSAIRRCRLRAN